MEDVGPDKRHLVANGLMSAFKKIWVDAWSARMEYILNNILLALLEYPNSTLLGVNRMLADKEYRKLVVENISDVSVRSFWTDEFSKYGDRYMQEAGAAIQNKVGQFISNPLVRNIIGQPKSSFDLRKMMDERKIIIINLSKGRVGEANANLIGSMIITKIYLSAMSRADVSGTLARKLPNFYLYVDEFQNFANESFADILSEARKYKLNLTIAHQYIEQMTDEVRAAVFGNVGTMIAFRVGAYDAEILEKEFAPTFSAQDMVNLGFIQIYLKLMIDGITSQPFSATTLPPIEKKGPSYTDAIIELSRKNFAKPRIQVEEDIRKWHQAEKVTAVPSQGRSRDFSKPRHENHNPGYIKEKPKQESVAEVSNKPFEKAFKDVSVDVKKENHDQKIEPVHLDSLKLNKDKSGGKNPRPDQKNDLRAALMAALKDTEANKTDDSATNKNKIQSTSGLAKEEEKKSETPPEKEAVKEVPLEVLKKVLETGKK
jgi:hypothetical protein